MARAGRPNNIHTPVLPRSAHKSARQSAVLAQLRADYELGFQSPYYIMSAAERDLLKFADEQVLDGIVVASDERLSYLTATYTGLRPYVGHPNQTPDLYIRREHVEQFFTHRRYASVGWLNPIDFLIVSAAEREAWPAATLNAWSLIYRNEGYSLFSSDRETIPAR